MENYNDGVFYPPGAGKEINLGASMGKQIASIFAYLILHRDRAVAKEQLIEIFWPDSRNPLNALKFAIF